MNAEGSRAPWRSPAVAIEGTPDATPCRAVRCRPIRHRRPVRDGHRDLGAVAATSGELDRWDCLGSGRDELSVLVREQPGRAHPGLSGGTLAIRPDVLE